MQVDQNEQQRVERDPEAESWAALEKELGDDAGHVGGSGEANRGTGSDRGGSEPDDIGDGGGRAPVQAEQPGADGDGPEAAEAGKSGPDPAKLAEQYSTALRDERRKRQELEREFSEVRDWIKQAKDRQQQASEPRTPDLDEDPVGYFDHKNRQLESELQETRQQFQEQQESFRAQQEQQQFLSSIAEDERAFSQSTPDYFDAIESLKQSRIKELEIMYPATEQGEEYARQFGYRSVNDLRMAHLNQEVMSIAANAYQTGSTPAQAYYALAKSRGWQGKPAVPAAQQQQAPSGQERIEITRKGAERSQSLSGAGGNGRATESVTVADLAELYETDPERADELFEKMAASGMLG